MLLIIDIDFMLAYHLMDIFVGVEVSFLDIEVYISCLFYLAKVDHWIYIHYSF